MRTVTVYSKPDCHLCEDAIAALEGCAHELGFELRELDITADEALHRAYFERIPGGRRSTARSCANTSWRRHSCASV